jgi:hypothetical protein
MDVDVDHDENLNINNRTTTAENQPLLTPSSASHKMELSDHYDSSHWHIDLIDDLDYVETIKQVENAIEAGILPVRIVMGSSGSYFVRNLEGVCFYF